MKRKIVVIQSAKNDIRKGKDYYKDINPSLAKEFLDRVKEGRIFISENPKANDVMYRNVRMHLLKQFPYHLHYYEEDERNKIVIIAVEFAIRENLDFTFRVK